MYLVQIKIVSAIEKQAGETMHHPGLAICFPAKEMTTNQADLFGMHFKKWSKKINLLYER